MGGAESKLQAEDKSALESTVEEKLKWVEANPSASTDDLKAAKKAVEEVANPIISKLYQNGSAGSEGGGGGKGEDNGGDGAFGEEKDEL